ncbi:MAG: hypothetical protein IIW81_06955 [Oscillospiraceae bacterium]|nr:hypothetical protein [Oscillospiraceae bacterium]
MLKKYFCVLIVFLAVLMLLSGCVSVKSAELVPGTTYVSAERIYTNHWHNSWFSVIDGEFTIEEKALRWVSSSGKEKTFPVEEWKWEEFPFSEEEWFALFDDQEDYFDLSPYEKIMFQPINDFNFLLLANGDLWFVGLSFINTGNDNQLVLWSIDKLVPTE